MYLQGNIYKGTHIHRPSLTKEMQTVLFLLFVSVFHAKNIKGPSECSSFTHYYEALSGAAQFNHSTPLLYKVFFTYLEKSYTSSIVIPLDRMDLCQVFHPTRMSCLIGLNTMVTVCAFCSNL